MEGVAVKVGIGFTVTVTVVGIEGQPFALAVIVNVVTCGVLVILVRIPEILAPPPLAAIPIRLALLSLVQVNVVPATPLGLVILIVLMAVPEHTV